MGRYRGVFLDRDGVINKERGHVLKWDEFEFIEGVIPAIRTLNEEGIVVAILTNQSSVARGLITMKALADIHQKMNRILAENGAHIDGIYVSPWHDNLELKGGVQEFLVDHPDRKPKPGMIIRAQKDFGFESSELCYLGDSLRDQIAATAAGVDFFAIKSSKCKEFGKGEKVYPSLSNLVSQLLSS